MRCEFRDTRLPIGERSQTRGDSSAESWPPNVAKATGLPHPMGVVVVADSDEPPLPFAAEYRDRLLELHREIETEGPFVAYSARVLIEARKPA